MSLRDLVRVGVRVGLALVLAGCGSSTSDTKSLAQAGGSAGSSSASAGSSSVGGSSVGGSSVGGSSVGGSSVGGSSVGGSSVGGSSVGGSSASAGATGSAGAKAIVPAVGWSNATGDLAALPSECGNLSDLSAKPDEDLLIAGVAQKGLWSSADGGKTWQQLGAAAGSDTITNRSSAIVYDPMNSKQFWESGIYNAGGVYKTGDDGGVLQKLGSVVHSDLVSVDFSDPDRKTLLAGGHEQSQTLNRSTDGGMTWAPVGSKLPPNTNCTTPLVIDSMTYLVGCGGYGGGVSGIYRSTDGGTNWAVATTSGGASAPLRAGDGSIYWASPNAHGMTRSTDDGKTWNDVVGGGQVTSDPPIALPDGRIATLSQSAVVVSADHGATWQAATMNLPYNDARGVVYSAQQKAFFVWHFSCGNAPLPVPADAVMRAEFDYEAN